VCQLGSQTAAAAAAAHILMTGPPVFVLRVFQKLVGRAGITRRDEKDLQYPEDVCMQPRSLHSVLDCQLLAVCDKHSCFVFG
jgi:hypothetical protein